MLQGYSVATEVSLDNHNFVCECNQDRWMECNCQQSSGKFVCVWKIWFGPEIHSNWLHGYFDFIYIAATIFTDILMGQPVNSFKTIDTNQMHFIAGVLLSEKLTKHPTIWHSALFLD